MTKGVLKELLQRNITDLCCGKCGDRRKHSDFREALGKPSLSDPREQICLSLVFHIVGFPVNPCMQSYCLRTANLPFNHCAISRNPFSQPAGKKITDRNHKIKSANSKKQQHETIPITCVHARHASSCGLFRAPRA